MTLVCALKLMNPATLTAGLWDEAQILRHLADDHILEIRNADLYAGQPYIVTALAEHGTLATELAATNGLGLGVDQVVTWTRQASMGIARAHDAGLVHNDIKPSNLFLTANKECLVGDFGLASRVPVVRFTISDEEIEVAFQLAHELAERAGRVPDDAARSVAARIRAAGASHPIRLSRVELEALGRVIDAWEADAATLRRLRTRIR